MRMCFKLTEIIVKWLDNSFIQLFKMSKVSQANSNNHKMSIRIIW